MDSTNEHIIAVPLGSLVVKKDKPVSSALDTPQAITTTAVGSKKQKTGPVITVRQVKTLPSHGDASGKKILSNDMPEVKDNQVAESAIHKNVSLADTQTKLQVNKVDAMNTKVLLTTDTSSKSHPTLNSIDKTLLAADIQIKSSLASFQEERVSLLSNVSDKTTILG